MVQKIFFYQIMLMALIPPLIQARPSALDETVDPSAYHGNLSPETILKVQQCERDASTMELCMRCAKVTKSEFVYPMCCNNDDSIKDWCKAYVYFGISEEN
ncbi:uncharacterized protein Dwil_GK22162 [Drosophila willistoni]|uniref:Uncharacterized protein n=1 Tax=Drosophila willistoni TaxID=7260 RepID=B4MY60_DROWI|nr:uncharacterized protein LOC6643429 [Drosophila willistoni]EDW77049.1 uncharacterized protein Dwil_GK22162 [Drosophila willistoni]